MPDGSQVKITSVETPENEDVNSLIQGHDPEILQHLIKDRKPISRKEDKEEKVEEKKEKQAPKAKKKPARPAGGEEKSE